MPAGRSGVGELVEAARAGDARATGRLLSLVENAAARLDDDGPDPRVAELASALGATAGSAHVLGLTGPPGVGKSTLTAALVSTYRARGLRVAVLAVDPSSPYSGGALLGDRIRLTGHQLDDGVFIRSMGSRGRLGGLSWASPAAVRVLVGCGFDVVLVETVGVGQAEVDIASLADTTIVVVAPGAGDAVQAAKSGLLEVADIYVVNKSDQPAAASTARDLRQMLSIGTATPAGGWRRPVLLSAAATGEGLPELVDGLAAHREWAADSGEALRRRGQRAAREIEALAGELLRRRLLTLDGGQWLASTAREVAAGRVDAWAAAHEGLAALARPDRTPPPSG